MKKLGVIFLLVTMIFALAACSDNPQSSSGNSDAVTQYTLPDTGGDSNSWFYEKFNTKSNTIDGEWFDTVGNNIVSDWCNRYDQERKAGTLDTTYPMLVKFIKDCNIPEETCRKVMGDIKNYEEKNDITPTTFLTDEEIQTVYHGDKKQISTAFVSEYCILVNGNIFTPEWLLNHPVSEYKSNGITYNQLKEKLDNKYVGLLGDRNEFLEIYEGKLQDLDKK